MNPMTVSAGRLASLVANGNPGQNDKTIRSAAYKERCRYIEDRLIKDGVYIDWNISPEPFFVEKKELTFIESLGRCFYLFYRASNNLYHESAHGRQPGWIAGYLDQGKPQSLIDYARMNRMKDLLPGIIRPDIILTEGGMVATELDAVPGGMGITGSLGRAYSSTSFMEGGNKVVGEIDGMIEGFLNMLKSTTRTPDPVIAIVVSEESRDYRSEMEWLAGAMREYGVNASTIRPEDIIFTEEGLHIKSEEGRSKIDVLYRFFELFDLKNIPKAELIMYSVKNNQVSVTPPFKPFLEEKMLYALFHHPMIRGYWMTTLGEKVFSILHEILPPTWILDPAELPPYGIIPGLKVGKRSVADWAELKQATQNERKEFVIKPSGFSELAWGSRGVVVGHDVSKKEWGDVIDRALEDFHRTPHILQKFHKGRHVEVNYLDRTTGDIKTMKGRVRLCPYYFVYREDVKLAGMMATVCPLDKKLIHGMTDSVMTAVARA
ncbi:MAG TPA: hypothetical protein ENI80_07465 [Acidiferrobacteraceae bacterium]|nr:hypothetical protein [Acidiferrobacteraceae bacterium]